MEPLLAGTAFVSLFHALIPSHWLPILALSRQEGWTVARTLGVTLLAGLAHVLSTVLLGGGLAAVGRALTQRTDLFSPWLAPALLVVLGVFYVIQHYRHHHFHLQRAPARWGVVLTLAAAMFFSPCLEVEGYFLAGGAYGWPFVAALAAVYGALSIAGMLVWMWLALHGLKRLNWHAWEHNAGLITGLTLIASGILLFFAE
jgi:nickel/cobalt exporter